jgi:CubicO group peptidase (beta-lactamase class C family)
MPPHPPAPPDLNAIVGAAVHECQPVPDTGTAVAILRKAELIFLGGFGHRDRERKTAVDGGTLFAIGSTTKAFTSLAATIAAEDGVIALDVPVRQYVPGFGMKDPEASRQMTLHDILSQQTGLPRHDALWYLGPFSQAQLFYRLPHLDPRPEPEFGFRKAFEYNNIMYTMAGHVLETCVGQKWADFLRTRVLVRLDMRQTHASVGDFAGHPNRALGYQCEAPLPLKNVENIAPAGALHSNAADMARWLALHLRRGVGPSGQRIVSEAGLEHIYHGHVAAPEAGKDVRYGLGWFLGNLNGRRLLFHSGHTDGYSAYVSFMPDQALGVVVLANQHHHPFPNRVAERLYQYLLGVSIERLFTPENVTIPTSLPLPTDVAAAPPGSKAAAVDRYTGRFANDGYGDVAVRRLGTALELSYYTFTWPLVRITDERFYFDLQAYGSSLRVPVIFALTPEGHVSAVRLVLEKKVAPITFARR